MLTAGLILAGVVLFVVLALGLYEAGRNFAWDSLDRLFAYLQKLNLFRPHVFTKEEEEARRSGVDINSPEYKREQGLGVTTTQKNEPWVYKPGREK